MKKKSFSAVAALWRSRRALHVPTCLARVARNGGQVCGLKKVFLQNARNIYLKN